MLEVLDWPFDLVRKLTCLPAEEEDYHHYWVYAWCIFGPAFLLFFSIGLNPIIYGILVVLSLVYFSLNICKIENKKEMPSTCCVFVMNIFSVLSGMMWSYLMIAILIDLLTCIGVLAKLSKVFIGLTVLAVGNALPDALTTLALAKHG